MDNYKNQRYEKRIPCSIRFIYEFYGLELSNILMNYCLVNH